MNAVIKIEISETIDELKELLKSIEKHKVKERIQALYWLTFEPAKTTVAIALLGGEDIELQFELYQITLKPCCVSIFLVSPISLVSLVFLVNHL